MYKSRVLMATQYSYVNMQAALKEFAEKNNVSIDIVPTLLLYAAEDFYTKVYHPVRFGNTLRNHHLLVNPNNMQDTPAHAVVNKGLDNTCHFDFLFPLSHRHLDLILNGYAKDVLSAYSAYVFDPNSIKPYNSHEKNYIKTNVSGNTVRLTLPVKEVVQDLLPLLEKRYLSELLLVKSKDTIKAKL